MAPWFKAGKMLPPSEPGLTPTLLLCLYLIMYVRYNLSVHTSYDRSLAWQAQL